MGAIPFTWLSPRPVLAYLRPPQIVNSALLSNHRPEVLIYYSNATAPDSREQDDYKQIIYWLYDSEEPRLLEIAREFEIDLTHFPLMVERDIRALENDLPATYSSLAGVVIATNPLARKGRIRVWRYPGREFGDVPIALPSANDPVVQSNPLSSPSTFEAILDQAKTLFDPSKYAFILVTKSHGTADLLMTPRLVTPANVGRKQILALARGEASLERPRPGISKADFVRVLQRLQSTPSMAFSLIFLESCDSGSELLDLPGLPINVGAIVATDDTGAKSYTISYEILLDRIKADAGSSPSTVFLRYLEERAQVINPYPTWNPIRVHLLDFVESRGLYLLPLLLFLAYFLWDVSRSADRRR